MLIHQLHLILSGLRTLSGSNHWDYAVARLKQERAAVGCYFFPEAENITTVP
ncbi:TPA: nucleocapsid protein [Escherichia coli]|nr:nucleocapsid protein [Escherichia coli]HAJ0086134.1 nucleocapsid protein [Escherichia coli]